MADKAPYDDVKRIIREIYEADAKSAARKQKNNQTSNDVSSRTASLHKQLKENKAALEEINKQIERQIRLTGEVDKNLDKQQRALYLQKNELKEELTFLSHQEKKIQKISDALEEHRKKAANSVEQFSAAQDVLDIKAQQHYQDLIISFDALTQMVEKQKEKYDLEQGAYDSNIKYLERQLELQTEILVSEDDSAEAIEAKKKALEDFIKTEEDLATLKKNHEERSTSAKREIAFQKSLNSKDENPANNIRSLFVDMKSIFGQAREKGASPLRAILSVRDTIKAGNDKSNATLEKLGSTISNAFNAMNAIVDNAARTVEASYGSVTAAIDGTGRTFDDIRQSFLGGYTEPGVGISTLVKQEDLLKEVTNLARDGISTDLESIAILSTIRDKTVASFNATDGNLRRLIRLNQNLGNLTAKQFGLAAVLRTELNAAFGDSSYIGKMFQQLTGTLLDAVSANALKGSTDSTNFYAVMETFAAGMYEAGVDEGTVSSLMQGMNYLGSGNVSALSGNKTLQNLLLLSMDRVGMDYATILQQGLTTEDTATLLQSIIEYLAQITEQNSKNNVLQSSYANLFNLSITDMAAIRNLAKNNTFMSMARNSLNQNNEYAMSMAIEELNQVSNRTLFSEKMNNVFENLKFSMGSGIASSAWGYPTHLISRLGIQAGQALTSMGLEKLGTATSLAGAVGYAVSMLSGIDDVLSGIGAGLNSVTNGAANTLSNYFSTSASGNGGMYDLGMPSNGLGTDVTKDGKAKGSFKGFDDGSYEQHVKNSEIYKESEVWEQEQRESEQDPNTKILKEFEKTLMKANEGDGYAFAVSLQGMSDGVLRSFASIFADEDAMMETLTGKNNALEDNNTFIDYVTDTSSRQSSSGSSSTTE